MADTRVQESELYSAFLDQIGVAELRDFLNHSRIHRVEEKASYLAISLSIPSVDLLAVIEQDQNRDSFQYYWEKPVDDFAMAASGQLERITPDGPSRFRDSSTLGKEILSRVIHVSGVKHQNAVVHLFGGFSFFDENQSPVWDAYRSASFTLPEWMIIKEGKGAVLTFLVELNPDEDFEELLGQIEERISELQHITAAEQYSLTDKSLKNLDISVPNGTSAEHERWINTIEKATNKIKSHAFDKVVLARELRLELDQPVKDTHILNRLRAQYPDCYSFLIRQDGESSFIGCTPERLASFNSKFVLTEGLAGSTSRGKTASEDAVLEFNLLHSSKDLREHEIVLDAIEENLVHYSDEVRHPKAPRVKKLSNVQHLYTPITAKIREGVSRTEVLKTLHPTPAVGGFPRDKAVEFIKEHEDFERGWYASPVGWINAHGNGEFIVAIRSGLIRNNEVRFFAGCGIVEDSDPEKEWEETNLKLIPMLSALEYAGT
jgi:menaquinone-specific isochorismate synthase